MKNTTAIAILLSITTAIPAFAGAYIDEEDTPFYWNLNSPEAPSVDISDDKPIVSDDADRAPVNDTPENRILKGYPLGDAPHNGVPTEGVSAVFEDKNKDVEISVAKPGVEIVGADAYKGIGVKEDTYKHAPVGADGKIRAIQDNPQTDISRRGGETAGSEAGYAHPDEIRRANSIDDYRPAKQGVGSKITALEEVHGIETPDGRILMSDDTWITRRGDTLKETLTIWADHAGYQLVWEAPYDFKMTADAVLEGTFLDAVGKALSAFEHSSPPIRGAVFSENNVLVVTTTSEFSGR